MPAVRFNEDGGYKTSGGLHGVGASVVNALSSWLEVTIYRDGKIWQQRFEDGGSKVGKLKVIGKSNQTGTTIHFMPDSSIFSVYEYNFSTISERLMESAFLLKGIKIDLVDERTGKEISYQYDNGLTAFVEYLNYEKETLNEIINN